MFTAIHVDDDVRSIHLLKMAAAAVPDLRITASFTSGDEAIAWLGNEVPDIIFLDVEMPEKNGIELARELSVFNADIIFITAHTGFAIKAFEACALDYLVKPVYAEKLQACMERYVLRRQKARPALSAASTPLQEQVQELFKNYISTESYPRRIFVNMVGETKVINLDEVLYFGTSGGPYTKIFLRSGTVVTCSESIKTYAESLQRHPDFVRIHRSYIINKKAVTAILRKDGSNSVKLVNGEVLGIAQQRQAEIYQQLVS